MADPRFMQVATANDLTTGLKEKSTVRLVVVGNGDWCLAAVSEAKTKATGYRNRMVLWIADERLLTGQLRTHLLGTDNQAACVLAMNLGMARRLSPKDAIRPTKVVEAFGNGESYTGFGFCLAHGPLTATDCPQCPSAPKATI